MRLGLQVDGLPTLSNIPNIDHGGVRQRWHYRLGTMKVIAWAWGPVKTTLLVAATFLMFATVGYISTYSNRLALKRVIARGTR